MIKKITAGVAIYIAILCAADSDIRINSVGFLPDLNKKASVVVKGSSVSTGTFTINKVGSDEAVFNGTLGNNINNSDTRDTVRVADFSDLKTPGKYYLEVPGIGKSPEFSIEPDVFNEAYRAMMLGMYLWRCGTAVDATYNGEHYHHEICHHNHSSLQYAPSGISSTSETKDGTGGWHDAGDFSKYTTNTVHTNGLFLKAWEHHGDVLGKIPLIKENDIKEGNIPAYLSEVKYNIDWLAKMQYEDGRVAEKISTLRHAAHVMPEDDNDTQYFVSWSTTATAGFVAVLALASRIYEPYDADLAAKWLEQAKKSYQVLESNASNVAPVQTNFSTGSYATNDSTHRRWAAVEMWETTGEAKYLNAFESGRLPNIWNHVSWDNVNVLAGITYLSSNRPGRRQSRVDSLSANIINYAGTLAGNTTSHGYGRVFGTQSYYWGHHGALTANSYILNTAYNLSSSEADKARYRNAVHEILGHIFGRNYFARSFVTGIGHNPPVQPHDRRSMATEKPWPGYLIGGPNNQSLTDQSGPVAPQGATCASAAVCYFDVYSDYARNEIAINWNASMIYALSGFVFAPASPEPSSSSNSITQSSSSLNDPSSSSSSDGTPILNAKNLEIAGNAVIYIYDLKGNKVLVPLADLPKGIYIAVVKSASGKQILKFVR